MDDIIVWQLGEFREVGAIQALRRITGFRVFRLRSNPLTRDRKVTVQLAKEALEKIDPSES